MRKILLIVSSNITGLQYHRQLIPHQYLVDTFNGFDIAQAKCDNDNFKNIPDEILKQFDCIYFLRQISIEGNTKAYIDRCHKLGCKVFFDIDDYWRLPENHLMYNQYKKFNLSKQVDECIKLSDLVITTTPFLLKHIKKLNQNAVVIPNCINHHKEQFQPRKIENARIRFGWIGGVFHYEDIKMMEVDFKLCYSDPEFMDSSQICLGGYTPGQKEYEAIEKVMTNNYKLDKDYLDYLKSGVTSMEHITFDQPYRRLYGRDVDHYGELYNEIDVALIPLRNDSFNASKSQLKVIEAGVMKRAVIASEVVPYILDCKQKNSIMVSSKGDWYKAMKSMTRSKIEDYSEALHEMVRERFDIDKNTKMRAEIYNHYLQ